jgi:methyl-accepting chemotaxis protein
MGRIVRYTINRYWWCPQMPTVQRCSITIAILMLSITAIVTAQVHSNSSIQAMAVAKAKSCAQEISSVIEQAEVNGELGPGSAFDRMYIPVPGSSPKRYRTSYDAWADKTISPILKNTLGNDECLTYVILMDPNGYVPVAPELRQMKHIPYPPVPKEILDTNEHLEAAKYTGPELIRSINDTSENDLMEVAVPVIVKNRTWGVIRIGYISR